jgi:hypothetical protein
MLRVLQEWTVLRGAIDLEQDVCSKVLDSIYEINRCNDEFSFIFSSFVLK